MAEILQYEINRDLLNPKFDGYKLSLEKFPMKSEKLPKTVYLPKIAQSQFALLHQHLFVNHNFLCYDVFDDEADKNDQIAQLFAILNDFGAYNIKYFKDSGKFEFSKVFEIDFAPEIDRDNVDQARYNATISLPSSEYAFVSNGYGHLWLCDRRDAVWKVLISDSNVLNGHPFTIIDSVQKLKRSESSSSNGDTVVAGEDNVVVETCLECLLKTVVESESKSGKFENKFVWLSFKLDDKTAWNLIQKRSIVVNGVVEYASLSRHCDSESICILSASEPKFVEDTLNPIQIIQPAEPELPKENSEGIPADPATNVTVEKTDSSADMVSLADDKQNGAASEPFNSRPAFNPDDLEECDMTSGDSLSLSWLDGQSHNVSRSIDFGGHQWLFGTRIDPTEPPYVCLRFDVDGILWRVPANPGSPELDNADQSKTSGGKNLTSAHFATFDAFGYVQAGKETRRLVTCDPHVTYAVIADRNRNVYVYWRAADLPDQSELRNRRTGHVINRLAKQQLISLPSEDADRSILGLAAARNNTLFVLTETSLFAFNVKSTES